MYHAHPSAPLQAHFASRPFQGAEPSTARFLFIGLDANYDETVESTEAFPSILEYHADGVAFWQRHRVHHPFLLPGYHGDGRRYHSNFARIGFTPADAPLVSFIELLNVPTVGRNKLTSDDLEPSHLERLDSFIRAGQAQHIFVSAGVARLMRQSRVFPWLSKECSDSGVLPVLYRQDGRTVYQHLHFSNYGRFQQKLETEAKAICGLLRGTAHSTIEPTAI